MELRDQDLTPGPKVPSPAPERKLNCFRIVKLEERIAPFKGGNGTKNCPSIICPSFHC
jgi:hypothetical protein